MSNTLCSHDGPHTLYTIPRALVHESFISESLIEYILSSVTCKFFFNRLLPEWAKFCLVCNVCLSVEAVWILLGWDDLAD